MTRMLLFTTTALFAVGAAAAQSADPVEQDAANRPDVEPAFAEQTRAPAVETDAGVEAIEVAGPLEHPWGIAVLPEDRGCLVTERPGRLRHVTSEGQIGDPIAGVPEVLAENQGGLLDVTLSPNFGEDRVIFLTYAKPMMDDLSATAAARAVLSEDLTELTEVEDIFLQSPASPTPMHYGARVILDGDGHAFVTPGEHFTEQERRYAQDLDKTYGKIVRVAVTAPSRRTTPSRTNPARRRTSGRSGIATSRARRSGPTPGNSGRSSMGPRAGTS